MGNVWVFQDARRRELLGDKCPWAVGWYSPDGKRKSKVIGCKSLAEKHARKIEGQLASGTYNDVSKKSWADFRREYEAKILPRLSAKSRESINSTLGRFERICAPARVAKIDTATIDDFTARRRLERGRRPGSKVSAASVNLDLRNLRAAFNVAQEWGYVTTPPKFRKLPELGRIGAVMSEEHLQLLYAGADAARLPAGLHCPPGEWWRALLVFAISTGWRIGEILALRRDDLDLATGRMHIRASDCKGHRDEIDQLPEAALEHVRKIVAFLPLVFPWPHDRTALLGTFHDIQKAAGVELVCRTPGEHRCTEGCKRYAFHSLRRGYATFNVGVLPDAVITKKMRHRSTATTRRYIERAQKMQASAAKVYVPEFLRTAVG